MARQPKQSVRKPATKLPQLQKKLAKGKVKPQTRAPKKK